MAMKGTNLFMSDPDPCFVKYHSFALCETIRIQM